MLNTEYHFFFHKTQIKTFCKFFTSFQDVLQIFRSLSRFFVAIFLNFLKNAITMIKLEKTIDNNLY